MDFLKRIKNYGLWVSLASLILLILQNAGVHVVAEQYNVLVDAILSFLIAAGIISNPTTSNLGFGDDKGEAEEAEETEKDEIDTL
ncbi:Bacteriophage holin [compost metagenome]